MSKPFHIHDWQAKQKLAEAKDHQISQEEMEKLHKDGKIKLYESGNIGYVHGDSWLLGKGKQINPMKMKLPSGKTLNGKELNKFKSESKNIYAKYLYYLYE